MKFDILKQATLFAVISAAMSSAALAAPAPINGQWTTQDKDAVCYHPVNAAQRYAGN